MNITIGHKISIYLFIKCFDISGYATTVLTNSSDYLVFNSVFWRGGLPKLHAEFEVH